MSLTGHKRAVRVRPYLDGRHGRGLDLLDLLVYGEARALDVERGLRVEEVAAAVRESPGDVHLGVYVKLPVDLAEVDEV